MNNYHVTIDEDCALTLITMNSLVARTAANIRKIAERVNHELMVSGPQRFALITGDHDDELNIPIDEGAPLFVVVETTEHNITISLYNTDDLPANAFIRILDVLARM